MLLCDSLGPSIAFCFPAKVRLESGREVAVKAGNLQPAPVDPTAAAMALGGNGSALAVAGGVQAFDSNIVTSSDIGTSVQGYDADERDRALI